MDHGYQIAAKAYLGNPSGPPIEVSPGALRQCVQAADVQREIATDIHSSFASAMERLRGVRPSTASDAKRAHQSEHTVVSALTEAQNDLHYALEGIRELVAELHRLID